MKCRLGYRAASDIQGECWVFQENCGTYDLVTIGSCDESTYKKVWQCDDFSGFSTGQACSPVGTCPYGLDCIEDLKQRRTVCSVICETDDDCYPNTECVFGIPVADVPSALCLRRCETYEDCDGASANCVRPEGADPAQGKFCFYGDEATD